VSAASVIAARLGDERQAGADMKCRCPLCGGRLALRDGDRGLLAWCFGGCAAGSVYRELRRLGHLTGDAPPLSEEEIAERKAAAQRKRQQKIVEARDLWDGGQPIVDTLADRYLRARGIDVLGAYISNTAREALRFHPRCRHSAHIYRPALLGRIDHVELGFIGVSATFLAVDGSDKAALDPPRKFFGVTKGGAVHLGEPDPEVWLCIGEGIESAASVAQACSLPAWAALSATGISNLVLPPAARLVLIAADHDQSGVGQRNAREAGRRFVREGRRARIAMPPIAGSDFNDVLLGRTCAAAKEARHAG
jgi:hypothetical protein